MKSEFNIWYLDDGSIGGDVSTLLSDLDVVRHVGPAIGLELNEDKCEIVTGDESVVSHLKTVLPSVRHISCDEALLLGAPIGDQSTAF